jgi:hypothetical protein
MLCIVVDAMLIRFKFRLSLSQMANNHVITHLLRDDDDESDGKKFFFSRQSITQDFNVAFKT